MGLNRKKSRRTKTGYSTDATVLEKLGDDHPVVPLVLEHRVLSKLKSTYIDALPQLVEPETGRVHTDFNQAVTATGSLCRQTPIAEGTAIYPALLDLYYKDDSLGDPLLTEARVQLLGVADSERLSAIEQLARRVNAV